MIVRPAQLRAIPSFLPPTSKILSIQSRYLSQRMAPPRIPPPTPFVPDPKTFLTLIGRDLSQHASKIPTWEALFSLTSEQLAQLGVGPPRSRRYLLRWREKFRNGQFGICGEAESVVDGAAHLRVVEVPQHDSGSAAHEATMTRGTRKIIANVPTGAVPSDLLSGQLKTIKGLKIKGSHTITGPHVQQVKGTGGKLAKVAVKEGLWEDRRGHKVDGGERRRAEVRHKRRSEEKKTSR